MIDILTIVCECDITKTTTEKNHTVAVTAEKNRWQREQQKKTWILWTRKQIAQFNRVDRLNDSSVNVKYTFKINFIFAIFQCNWKKEEWERKSSSGNNILNKFINFFANRKTVRFCCVCSLFLFFHDCVTYRAWSWSVCLFPLSLSLTHFDCFAAAFYAFTIIVFIIIHVI